ncbi:MAG: hypothetical protein EA398_10025 [Deltaproteobacteria bacterium]|nr:MAG: hypothetical protein EA398_10025 [Deltaproteobacteria bacterium]
MNPEPDMGMYHEIHEGPVLRPLPPSPRELLEELCGVVEAVQERDYPLTRTGIPPKPLWTAINERLHWQDPETLLHDWDECDQVRFAYALAWELRLIEKDDEQVLRVGGGADPFFTADPLSRGLLLRNAWVDMIEWDERCDARDQEGYRHNFGRFFRRDFLRSPAELREALIAGLAAAPDDTWLTGTGLAASLTALDPALLHPEDHPKPDHRPGRIDPEIARLADYALFLAVRFGWVELARRHDEEAPAEEARIFRLTALGRAVLDGRADDPNVPPPPDERRPFILDASRDITLFRHEADFGDEYLARRVAQSPPMDWSEPAITYRLDKDSVARALDNGMDPELFRARVLDRARTPVPDTLAALFDDALRALDDCSIVRGLTALELPEEVARAQAATLREHGFTVLHDTLVLVPWTRWAALCQLLGGAPTEGFRYPAEEPLATIRGNAIGLEWAGLPIAARDLLDALGLDEHVDEIEVDKACLERLAEAGWTRASVASAIAALTGGPLPRSLRS